MPCCFNLDVFLIQDQLFPVCNRFTFLFTLGGILRGESVYMAKLSDLLHAKIQRPEGDPHPVTVVILQMATGKTNQELKLYARSEDIKMSTCAQSVLSDFILCTDFTTQGSGISPLNFQIMTHGLM
jgi:hypothetical protein